MPKKLAKELHPQNKNLLSNPNPEAICPNPSALTAIGSEKRKERMGLVKGNYTNPVLPPQLQPSFLSPPPQKKKKTQKKNSPPHTHHDFPLRDPATQRGSQKAQLTFREARQELCSSKFRDSASTRERRF